jgi:hypothetical protein
MTSPDGLAWTARFSGTYSRLAAVSIVLKAYNPLGWTGSMIVAAGDSGAVLTATDGTTWTVYSSGTTNDLYGIANDGNGRFGAIGKGGAFVTAPDGINWINEQNANLTNLNALVYANGNYLAVGDSGAIEACIAWLPRNPGGTQNLSAVTYGGGNFIAVGNAILQSANGQDWANISTGLPLSLSGVAYGADQYVAVGATGILTSSNGLNWSSQFFIGSETNVVESVAFGNGVFVAIGQYSVYQYNGFESYYYWYPVVYLSTNGISWTGPNAVSNVNPEGSPGGNSIIFGNNLFLWVGVNGLATSPDGITWADRNSGVSYDLFGVTYGDGLFVAVAGTQLTTSLDGTNWTATNTGSCYNDAITYGDNGFVALGEVFAHSNSISSSPDGINWVPRGFGGDIFNPGLLNAIAFGQASYVIVGNKGTILQSTSTNAQAMPLISCSMSNTTLNLNAIAQPGYTYRIQFSTNLLNWSDEFVFTSTQNVTSFSDTGASTNSSRFYRIKTP